MWGRRASLIALAVLTAPGSLIAQAAPAVSDGIAVVAMLEGRWAFELYSQQTR